MIKNLLLFFTFFTMVVLTKKISLAKKKMKKIKKISHNIEQSEYEITELDKEKDKETTLKKIKKKEEKARKKMLKIQEKEDTIEHINHMYFSYIHVTTIVSFVTFFMLFIAYGRGFRFTYSGGVILFYFMVFLIQGAHLLLTYLHKDSGDYVEAFKVVDIIINVCLWYGLIALVTGFCIFGPWIWEYTYTPTRKEWSLGWLKIPNLGFNWGHSDPNAIVGFRNDIENLNFGYTKEKNPVFYQSEHDERYKYGIYNWIPGFIKKFFVLYDILAIWPRLAADFAEFISQQDEYTWTVVATGKNYKKELTTKKSLAIGRAEGKMAIAEQTYPIIQSSNYGDICNKISDQVDRIAINKHFKFNATKRKEIKNLLKEKGAKYIGRHKRQLRKKVGKVYLDDEDVSEESVASDDDDDDDDKDDEKIEEKKYRHIYSAETMEPIHIKMKSDDGKEMLHIMIDRDENGNFEAQVFLEAGIQMMRSNVWTGVHASLHLPDMETAPGQIAQSVFDTGKLVYNKGKNIVQSAGSRLNTMSKDIANKHKANKDNKNQ